MTGFDPLYQRMTVLFIKGIDKINGRLVNGKDIKGCQDTDIRCDNRFCRHALAVAGYRHISQHVHKTDVFSEMIHHCFG